jgi:hypothetical protein
LAGPRRSTSSAAHRAWQWRKTKFCSLPSAHMAQPCGATCRAEQGREDGQADLIFGGEEAVWRSAWLQCRRDREAWGGAKRGDWRKLRRAGCHGSLEHARSARHRCVLAMRRQVPEDGRPRQEFKFLNFRNTKMEFS